MRFIVVFFLIFGILYTQKKSNPSLAQQDFKIFKSILTKGHPSLYEYVNKEYLDSIMSTEESTLTGEISDMALYKKMLFVSDKIKDANLLLIPPKTFSLQQHYFPLILKLIDKEFYTDTDDYGIPIGSKIIKINDKITSSILKDLEIYSSSNGYNTTKKYRDIELKFGFFYSYQYGIEKHFSIDYTTPQGNIKNITLPAEPYNSVQLRETKRNSYFFEFHKKIDKNSFFKNYHTNKMPFLFFKEKLKTAILVVNSFAIDSNKFSSYLETIFKEIKKKKVKHLVIDVRNNEGGYRENAIYLYSYLTSSLFKQRISEFVSSLSIPERKYSSGTFIEDEKKLKKTFYDHPSYNGWELSFDNLETIMVPNTNNFNGKIHVLTGGKTVSEGSDFALLAKNDPEILLIGEETGGGYYFQTGEFPIYYELPNSRIKLIMFMKKINHYVKNKTIPEGSGVIPDKKIHLSVLDLIKGNDPLLDYVFKQIKLEYL